MRLFGFLLVVLFALSLPGLLFLVFLRAFFPGLASWFIGWTWYRSCCF